jgi:hypothetical protein
MEDFPTNFFGVNSIAGLEMAFELPKQTNKKEPQNRPNTTTSP